MALAGFADTLFGAGTLRPEDVEIAPSAAGAGGFLRSSYRPWREGIAAIGEPRWPAGQEPLRALRSLWKRIGARVDDDERPHSLRVTRGEVDRVEATHGVTDDGRALDAELIEHGKCIRHEVGGRVAVRGPPTLAVAGR